jgi:hypothetical protein
MGLEESRDEVALTLERLFPWKKPNWIPQSAHSRK